MTHPPNELETGAAAAQQPQASEASPASGLAEDPSETYANALVASYMANVTPQDRTSPSPSPSPATEVGIAEASPGSPEGGDAAAVNTEPQLEAAMGDLRLSNDDAGGAPPRERPELADCERLVDAQLKEDIEAATIQSIAEAPISEEAGSYAPTASPPRAPRGLPLLDLTTAALSERRKAIRGSIAYELKGGLFHVFGCFLIATFFGQNDKVH